MSRIVFNPPPGWPPPPPDWMPPLGWEAPHEWPEPPPNWVLFLESPGAPAISGSHRLASNDEGQESWWGEGGGYHSAYQAASERESLGQPLESWGGGSSRGGKGIGDALVRGRRIVRRSAIAFAITIPLVLFFLATNSSASRAIAACESAVMHEADARGADPATDPGGDMAPASPPGLARPEVRYVLMTPPDEQTVSIAGDYTATNGAWYTFTCSARHAGDSPVVTDVELMPVVPVTPGSGASTGVSRSQ